MLHNLTLEIFLVELGPRLLFIQQQQLLLPKTCSWRFQWYHMTLQTLPSWHLPNYLGSKGKLKEAQWGGPSVSHFHRSQFFLKKMGHTRPLFVYFRSFQTNIKAIFATNQCE